MKNMHRHEMQQTIIYLNKQFSRVLFPCENQGVTIRNWNEESCFWSLVATTSLDRAAISLP
jgi:hypothetical protein